VCGIAGFWSFGGGNAEAMRELARTMAGRLAHRGPDDDGTWVDHHTGVAFGFRRLSIIDLSPAGAQPMVSDRGRYVIIFNGEIYNHQRLRARLESEGVAPQWRGHSDTEVLLACIDAWGLVRAVSEFIGMFAFALWDTRMRTLSLVRDRAGVKPLYYALTPTSLFFASEVKALAPHPEFDGSVDPVAAALYGRYRYVPGPRSIYRGVQKLAPGSILTITPSRSCDVRTYWDAARIAEHQAAHRFEGSADDAASALEQLLSDAVALRMIADVPLGVFLSGGVDSSLVTALMQRQSSRPVRTFTIGFEDPRQDEARFGAEVAAHLGAQHEQLYVSADEALRLIPEVARIYGEPFADSSNIPTYLVSRLARQSVTVALSGDGGDELFAGYHRHFLGRRLQRRVHSVPKFLRRPLGHALQTVARSERTRTLGAALIVGDPVVTYWQDMQLDPLIGANQPLANIATGRTRVPARLADPTEAVMYLDFTTYLPDDILVKVDRASMANSLEVRAPFLDHRVIELAWSLPLEMKIRHDRGKWIERHLLRRYIPDELVDREKQGFGLPLANWLRGPLRPWAEELLQPRRLREHEFVDVDAVANAWKHHQEGNDSFEPALWTVLMFQSWLDHQRPAATR
jgi:asparagine synthase (glutamine-hydrolysing)